MPAIHAALGLLNLFANGPHSLNALHDLFGGDALLSRSHPRVEPYYRPKNYAVSALLRDHPSNTLVLLELESELAAHICAVLLRRQIPVVDRFRPAPDSVQGAVGAFLLAASRKSLAQARMDLIAVSDAAKSAFSQAAQQSFVAVDAQIDVGHCYHRLTLNLLPSPGPLLDPPRFDSALLRKMGDVAIDLPMIGARFSLATSVVNAIGLGDVLMPGEGWLIHGYPEDTHGHLLLRAPQSQFALRAELHRNCELVLGEKPMNVSVDEALAPPQDDTGDITIADAIAQAPLVVQIELGTVALSAAHWADLKPGDVISTGRPLGDRVTVRIAGREVASGELVDVDGELGVRIKSFTSAERVPQ